MLFLIKVTQLKMQVSMPKSLLPIICLGLIFFLSNCQRPTIPPKDLKKITVAFTSQPQSTLVHVAMAKGYFVEEGVQLVPDMQTFGKAALKSVLEHKADLATVAETPIMFAILKGEKIFVIANIESSNSNNGIVARLDTGIKTAADLKEKKVGFTPGTTSDFFLDSFLTAHGMNRKDINAVELKPDEMELAISSKKVDALSTWNYPLTQTLKKLGASGTIFYDREIYTETFNIAGLEEFIKKNPEMVKSFLRALIKAENYVAKNPEEAQGIMSSATKIDKGLIKEVWSAFNYHVVLGQELVLTLEDETRWAIKNKLTDKQVMPDYMKYISVENLQEINPQVVKLKN
jgi:NitT/TauT family transport system substrate-binding protein